MPTRLEILIDAVDHSDDVREETIALECVADGGEIGSGGFDREDLSLDDVPALKDATAEDSRATVPRLFTGMSGERSLARAKEKRGTARSWNVTLWDLNALLDSVVLESSDANRPAETDYARVTWLLGTSDFAAIGVTAGVVPNTNTANLDAQDYRREAGGARRVLSDCGEAAQKNYFLYDFGAGAKLYYDKHTGTSLSSSLRLSTVPADVDHATTFELLAGAELRKDPAGIWSKVVYKYDGGYVTRDDADAGVTTSTDFRRRETVVEDSTVKSSAKATSKADKYLVAASTELERFTCSCELPAENAGDIQAGQRIQIKAPHLGISAFTYFRITRRILKLAETDTGVSREVYRLDLEFAADVKITSFNDSRPPGDSETAGTADDVALTLVRYQGSVEAGSAYFGPAAGLWDRVAPAAFALGTISAAVDGILSRTPEGNIPWPYTDCGVGTGGVAGLGSRGVWHRTTIDLSGDDVVGIRVTVAPFLVSGSGYTESPSGFLVGEGTVVVGVATGTDSAGADLADFDDYIECGRVGDQGGEVFIPASLLLDVSAGYVWIVLVPGWEISSGLFFCNSAGNKPWGYGKTGHDSNASSIVSALAVIASGSGWSPWLPATGDVDGTNLVFGMPLWNGKGIPELKVGSTLLVAGEYSVDTSTLEATLVQAPGDELDGQVFYRAKMGG